MLGLYGHSSIEGNVHSAREANRNFLSLLFAELSTWHQHPVLVVGDANLDVKQGKRMARQTDHAPYLPAIVKARQEAEHVPYLPAIVKGKKWPNRQIMYFIFRLL
eukprot:237629-Amphidinium_carterae.1